MGWFWNTTASSPNPTPTPTPTASSQPPPSTPQDSHGPQAEPAQRLSADDQELAQFLAMLHTDSSRPSQPYPVKKPSTNTSPNRPTPASAAINDAILPTEMSCRDAFDYAWHCNTPAAQWNAVYRYGGVRSCSDLWDDFWFCMRTKSYSPEMRAEAVREHYRERQNEKYYAFGRPSSEDVGESRDRLVEAGTAFRVKFDDPRENDTEWNLKEIERRKKIREQTFGKEG